MISDLDETIRQILVQGGKLDQTEIDISFEIPNREWSTGIARPTINCYLFDIRENRELRMHGLERATVNGRPARKRAQMFVDLTYLVTAWTRAVEDEHRLLWHALQTFMRYETIPAELLQGALREVDGPITSRTALPESVLKSPGEFWTALENQIKPSLSYVVTLALDRELLAAGPPVLTATVRYPWPGGVDERTAWFGGVVRGEDGKPAAGAAVEVEGHGLQATADSEGRFRIRVPGPGRYTLAATLGRRTSRREIVIPEPSFDIDLT